MSKPCPKRLIGVRDTLQELVEWTWIERRITDNENEQAVWNDVRDWALGKAKGLNLEITINENEMRLRRQGILFNHSGTCGKITL